MATIQSLHDLDTAQLSSIITGYTSHEKYTVTYTEKEEGASFVLHLTPLDKSRIKKYEDLDEETVTRYQQVMQLGYSFGAYSGDTLAGIALAEPHGWNQTLWVWEFHIDEAYQRQGIGKQMMDALVEKAKAAGLRAIVCETQTTNVPAIRFYRSMGFRIEGVDLSYYSNQDYPDGEIAVFMKRLLG